MKTDKYKDWEYKFFEAEELTPEEEMLLKNEVDHPYFSFLKEEKKEKLDLSFEDFLTKVVSKNVVPLSNKKSLVKYYAIAASLTLLLSVGVLWQMTEVSKVDNQTLANHKDVKTKVESPKVEVSKSKEVNDYQDISNKDAGETVAANSQPRDRKLDKEKDLQLVAKNDKTMSDNKTTDKEITSQKISDFEYNPNYVIVNGKPIANEQEAIAVTENTFNYFANNVSQTIKEAENANNLSKDLYKIINY